MEPWMSWTAFATVTGGLGYYYYATAQGKKKSASVGSEKAAKRKGNGIGTSEGSGSDVSAAKRLERRKKPARTKSAEAVQRWMGSEDDTHGEKDTHDVEFAKAMSGVRAGSTSRSNGKVPKTPVAQKINPERHMYSTASSATGAEADDDLSSAGSPVLKPSGDISDMLEPPATTAAILRLTEPEKPVQAPRRQVESFQTQESKKQRQNRKKNEERKQQRELEEAERRKKMEQQLRTARQANASSNQTRTNVATAAAASAWSKPRDTAEPDHSLSNAAAQKAVLLDTFDEQVEKEMHAPHHKGVPGHHGVHHVVRVGPTSSHAAQTNLLLDAFDTNPAITPPSPRRSQFIPPSMAADWQKDLPSEEEQIRMLNEQNGWSTVENKKTKKKSGDKSATESTDGEAGGFRGKMHDLKDTLTGHGHKHSKSVEA